MAAAVGGIISGVGSIVGAGEQAGANKNATAATSAATAQALQFEQQKYNDLKTRLAPYVGAGQSSTQRMAQLLRLPNPGGPTQTAAYNAGMAPTGAQNTAPVASDPSQWAAPQGAGVDMRAPNGSVMHVYPHHVDHWKAQGAQEVAS